MQEEAEARIPGVCAALLWCVAWLVPKSRRDHWLFDWHNSTIQWWEFLLERDGRTLHAHAKLLFRCAFAIPEAFWLRFDRDQIRRFIRGPRFILLAAAAGWLIITLATSGFTTLRSVWGALPYRDPARLVSIYQVDSFGAQHGIPGEQLGRWSQEAKLVSAIGGYSVDFRRGWATSGLFADLGVRPVLGRTFRIGDRGVALVNERYWRGELNADPGVIGRTFVIDSQGGVDGKVGTAEQFTVVGVLPRSLPGLSSAPDFWTVLPQDQPGAAALPYHLTTVARLRPGVEILAVERELNRLAHRGSRWLIARAHVSPLQGRLLAPLGLYAFTVGFGVTIGLIMVVVGKRSPVAADLRWRQRLRCWGFLVLKTVLALGALTILWIELTSAAQMHISAVAPREMVMALVLPASFLLTSGLVVLWSVLDQKGRCPICLHRLSMPVAIGSWGSPLLEPASTEFLCEQGHGSLCTPETQSSSAEPDHWTPMDDSWKDLFTR